MQPRTHRGEELAVRLCRICYQHMLVAGTSPHASLCNFADPSIRAVLQVLGKAACGPGAGCVG
jgi:hypothetical protein